jgi:ubiquinone/menaquinone biosynthesis C-methylase UbiE
MSHFNHVANTWDSEGKIKLMGRLANNTCEKLKLKKDLDILDFGCGTGLFGLEFLDFAKSITGIDTSEGMLEVFKEKAKGFDHIDCHLLDLEKEPFESEKRFDLIISSMTFHHLNDPSAMIEKLSGLLKVGGQMAIVDLEKEDGTFHPNNEEMGVKHFGFSEDEIKSWANKANLGVEVHTINSVDKNDRTYNQFLALFRGQ